MFDVTHSAEPHISRSSTRAHGETDPLRFAAVTFAEDYFFRQKQGGALIKPADEFIVKKLVMRLAAARRKAQPFYEEVGRFTGQQVADTIRSLYPDGNWRNAPTIYNTN